MQSGLSSAGKIQGVGRIVDVVDASVHNDESEQSAGSRRVATAVKQCPLDLFSIGSRFYQVPVVPIDGQDISVCNGQAERIVEATPLVRRLRRFQRRYRGSKESELP